MEPAPPPPSTSESRPPLRWADGPVDPAVRLELARVVAARRQLWVPLVVWLLGTPAGLYATFVSAFALGGAAVLVLLLTGACLMGSPVVGMVVARRAASGHALACYGAVLALSVVLPLCLLAWAADAWG